MDDKEFLYFRAFLATSLSNFGNNAEEYNGYKEFKEKLLQFIDVNRPTIATLNYDNLLYGILCSKYEQLLKDKNGYTDGFYADGAEEKSPSKNMPEFIRDFFIDMTKTTSSKRVAYLHLHGAYLYTQSDSRIEKQPIGYTPEIGKRPLAILTSQKKKIQYVFNSPQDFFRTYSGYFFEKLLKANHIIIFGYGGGDEYLNTNLRYATKKAKAVNSTNLKITIICRGSDCSDSKLCEKWSKILTGEENKDRWVEIENNKKKPLGSQKENTCKIRKFSNLKEFEWNYENNSAETQTNI